jgi:hypothetical protein
VGPFDCNGDGDTNDQGEADGEQCPCVEPDSDGDTVPDASDNCPGTANPGQEDADNDGLGDVCDDSDGDGIWDSDELRDGTDPTLPDTDADGSMDGVDNCPLTPNAGQENADTDAPGDACDNCDSAANDDQLDGDIDDVGDACDNCVATPNTDQSDVDLDTLGDACDPDIDGDGAPNALDCAASDATAQEAPVEVGDVRILPAAGVISIAWTMQPALGSSGAYDILRGRLSELWADRGFARAACFASRASMAPTPIDPAAIPLGDGDWYLVRSANACGIGGWGASFGGPDARAPLNATPSSPCP